MAESKIRPFIDVIKNFGNRNVLSPLITLSFFISLPIIHYLAVGDINDTVLFFFFCLITGVVLSTIIAYYIILFKSPEELGSEDYRVKIKEIGIRQQLLDLIEQKGDNIPLEPTSLQAISQPHQLLSDQKENRAT